MKVREHRGAVWGIYGDLRRGNGVANLKQNNFHKFCWLKEDKAFFMNLENKAEKAELRAGQNWLWMRNKDGD